MATLPKDKYTPKRMTHRQLLDKLFRDRQRRLFIISAIEVYAKQVLEDKSDWSQSLINKDWWDVLANDCLRIIEQNNDK